MGLPVIATNIGGSPEQVVEGVTGFLIAPNDVEALANRIEELAKNPERRVQFGTAGVERIRKCFSLEQTTREVEELYRRILRS